MTKRFARSRVYFAAPLFSEAELAFNIGVVRRIEKHFDVFLPQRDGGLLLERIKNGLTPAEAELDIFHCDIDAMRRADLLIAVLDGSSVDEGVAFEIGYMHCLERPCIGLQTDVRRALPTGNNPMIAAALKDVFVSVDALEDFLSTFRACGHPAAPNGAYKGLNGQRTV